MKNINNIDLTKTHNITFGMRLKDARKASGYGLKQIADKMNWSASYLSDIERGKRNPPSFDAIRKLAELVVMDVHLLMALSLEKYFSGLTSFERQAVLTMMKKDRYAKIKD